MAATSPDEGLISGSYFAASGSIPSTALRTDTVGDSHSANGHHLLTAFSQLAVEPLTNANGRFHPIFDRAKLVAVLNLTAAFDDDVGARTG
jgi:hypothetical protein